MNCRINQVVAQLGRAPRSALPTDRSLDGGERIGAVCTSAQHRLRHPE